MEMAGNLENAIFGGLLLLPGFAIALPSRACERHGAGRHSTGIVPSLTVGVLYWASMSEPPFLFFLFLALLFSWLGWMISGFWMFSVAGGVSGWPT